MTQTHLEGCTTKQLVYNFQEELQGHESEGIVAS